MDRSKHSLVMYCRLCLSSGTLSFEHNVLCMAFLLVYIWLDAGCVGANDRFEMAKVGAFLICGSHALVLEIEG